MAFDNWETPQWLCDALQQYTKTYCTLDVAASKDNTKCNYFISEEEDALTTDWHTRLDYIERTTDACHDRNCWMNPPYSRGNLGKFTRRAIEMLEHDITTLSLVKVDTSTDWWRNITNQPAKIIFIHGRIRFEQNGIPSRNANFPSAAILFSNDFGDLEHDYVSLHQLRNL